MQHGAQLRQQGRGGIRIKAEQRSRGVREVAACGAAQLGRRSSLAACLLGAVVVCPVV